jgi:hypothetical protein
MDAVVSPPLVEGFAPPCPKCQAPLTGLAGEADEGAGRCGACSAPIEFVLFPARRRTKPVARAARSVEGDSTCYFHPANHAAVICDGCGRYLCVVCEVPGEGGKKLCPPCVSSARKKSTRKADEVVVYDQMALSLALLPLVMWPITLITSPAVLGLVIYGWRKPRSLVRRGRWRFLVAGLIALLQIGGWVALGVSLWLES